MIQRDVGKVPRKPKEKSIPLTSKRITVGLLGNGIDFLEVTFYLRAPGTQLDFTVDSLDRAKSRMMP